MKKTRKFLACIISAIMIFQSPAGFLAADEELVPQTEQLLGEDLTDLLQVDPIEAEALENGPGQYAEGAASDYGSEILENELEDSYDLLADGFAEQDDIGDIIEEGDDSGIEDTLENEPGQYDGGVTSDLDSEILGNELEDSQDLLADGFTVQDDIDDNIEDGDDSEIEDTGFDLIDEMEEPDDAFNDGIIDTGIILEDGLVADDGSLFDPSDVSDLELKETQISISAADEFYDIDGRTLLLPDDGKITLLADTTELIPYAYDLFWQAGWYEPKTDENFIDQEIDLTVQEELPGFEDLIDYENLTDHDENEFHPEEGIFETDTDESIIVDGAKAVLIPEIAEAGGFFVRLSAQLEDGRLFKTEAPVKLVYSEEDISVLELETEFDGLQPGIIGVEEVSGETEINPEEENTEGETETDPEETGNTEGETGVDPETSVASTEEPGDGNTSGGTSTGGFSAGHQGSTGTDTEAESETETEAESETETEEESETETEEDVFAAAAIQITSQPESIYVNPGKTGTFEIEASGNGLTYQWQFCWPDEESWSNFGSATSSTLSRSFPANWHGLKVRCVVKDSNGNQEISEVAYAAVGNILILKQPENLTVAANGRGTFEVEALGSGLAYQWQFCWPNEDTFSNFGSATESILSRSFPANWDGLKVRCLLKDDRGNQAITEQAVVEIGEADAIRIIRQPQDLQVPVGGSGTFEVEAEGTGLTYQWQFCWPNEEKFSNFGNATSPILTRSFPANWDGLKIRCVIKDSSGAEKISDVATVTVGEIGPIITRDPENVTVQPGGNATFTVEATGSGLTYQWQFCWPNEETFSNFGNANASTLTRSFPANWNGLKIRCVVTDQNGKQAISKTAIATVGAVGLSITKQPESITVEPGGSGTFSITAEGTGLTYQWQFCWPNEETFSNFGNATAATLTRNFPANWNGLKVRCVVKDSRGQQVISEVATVTVGTAAALEITRQPESITVEPGGSGTFEIEATGTNVTYQWQFCWPNEETFSNFGSATAATLTRSFPANWNGLKVRCVVKDSTGQQLISDVVTVTIGSAEPLEITSQPQSITIEPGEVGTFEIEATGTDLTYQWQFCWPNEETFSNFGNATDPILIRTFPANWNGLKVRCVVKDGSGRQVISDVATATVKQMTPLGIITQPENVTVEAGTSGTFTIEAEGDGLSYLWQYCWAGETTFSKFGGTQTNTLTRSLPVSWNGMKVRCIVTDEYGASVTSDEVVIHTAVQGVVYDLIDGRMNVTGFMGTPVDVTIQETFNGKTVVEIADEAFYNETTLESVDMPDTIEIIGVRAFAGCTSLNQVN